MGRPPKPLEDHILDGTYRKDRQGSNIAQMRPDGYAEKPKDLGEHASFLWDYIIDDLHRRIVATKIDTPSLVMCCEWYEQYKLCMLSLCKLKPIDSEYYRVQQQAQMAWKAYDSIARQFGLSPTSRNGLKVTEPIKNKPAVRSRNRSG